MFFPCSVAKYLINASTLVIGIDVAQESPLTKVNTSICSVAGSVDMMQMRYAVSVKVHKNYEYLDPKLIVERIRSFYKLTNTKPDRLIVYREGMCETDNKVKI